MSITAPEFINGRMLWLDGEVREVVQEMQAIDPALALYRDGDRWLVYRHAEDGSMHLVTRSKPGASLLGLPTALRLHDARQRNVVDEVVRHNDVVRREAERRQADIEAEARDVVRSQGRHFVAMPGRELP